MVYKFFNKKSPGSGVATPNQLQLANEVHKSIIRKCKRTRVYSSFKVNIDLTGMQLISKCNKGIRYLLCAIDVFSKYAWVVPFKNKKVLLLSKHFKVI